MPSALLPHLAERRAAAEVVAEAAIVDTVALLAWVAGVMEDEDKHAMATSVSMILVMVVFLLPLTVLSQALAAAQVLQVRNNRSS